MKRFWSTVETESDAEGWRILLDGKPLRVPGGAPLRLDSPALAQAVADEWRQAGGEPGGEAGPADLPLTSLANTAQERVAPQREAMALELARYGETDLLCYRATAPQALVEREHAEWQPWLDWAAETFGARLRATSGIVHVPQDPEALAVIAAAMAREDVPALTALGVLVPALGSVVLGLAVTAGALDPAPAHRLSILDELYQAEFWQADAEALERRRLFGRDIDVAGRFLRLSRA